MPSSSPSIPRHAETHFQGHASYSYSPRHPLSSIKVVVSKYLILIWVTRFLSFCSHWPALSFSSPLSSSSFSFSYYTVGLFYFYFLLTILFPVFFSREAERETGKKGRASLTYCHSEVNEQNPCSWRVKVSFSVQYSITLTSLLGQYYVGYSWKVFYCIRVAGILWYFNRRLHVTQRLIFTHFLMLYILSYLNTESLNKHIKAFTNIKDKLKEKRNRNTKRKSKKITMEFRYINGSLNWYR